MRRGRGDGTPHPTITPPTSWLPPRHSASFKNKENVDLSKVAAYKQAENDTGSTQVQIARLSARVEQISKHLIANKKDNSSKCVCPSLRDGGGEGVRRLAV